MNASILSPQPNATASTYSFGPSEDAHIFHSTGRRSGFMKVRGAVTAVLENLLADMFWWLNGSGRSAVGGAGVLYSANGTKNDLVLADDCWCALNMCGFFEVKGV